MSIDGIGKRGGTAPAPSVPGGAPVAGSFEVGATEAAGAAEAASGDPVLVELVRKTTSGAVPSA